MVFDEDTIMAAQPLPQLAQNLLEKAYKWKNAEIYLNIWVKKCIALFPHHGHKRRY